MIEYENLRELNRPFFAEYLNKCKSVFESGWFILGDEVKEFEKRFASYCGSKYCIGVANGLDALTLSLRCFDFPEGSEVIVPSNTYIATILSILNCHLKPILVEPNISTYNIDPSKIEQAVSSKTVAIMVVHLYGKCCSMDEVLSICNKYSLRLIEDCAQAHGAKYKGRKAGTFGDFGAFSFYPTKNLGALGDGGGVNTDSEELQRKIAMMRNYGSEKKYYNDVVGINSRLDELQAAFLNVKLFALDAINDYKRKLASVYSKGLKDDFIKPVVDEDYFDVYHIYNVRHPGRDELKSYLLKHGICTEVHYPVAPHHQVAMIGVLSDMDFPIAEEIHSTTLSLPISFFHSEDEVSTVVEIMNRF
jgi:dTDP-4-amino-4,6-dideoxygalactose transaminase